LEEDKVESKGFWVIAYDIAYFEGADFVALNSSLKVGVRMYVCIPEDLVGIMPKTNHHHGPMRKS
jgi:hypothetical protein